MRCHPFYLWFLAVLVLPLAGSEATAHAIIVEAQPAVDAVVRGSEVKVSLRFNSRIDPRRSRLTLLGGSAPRNLDITTGTSTDTLAATVTGLTPGSYRLRWQVLALDGHITRGDIPFQVVDH